MILGLGMDVVEIVRIERILCSYGQRFLNHVFTETERNMAPDVHAAAVSYYAGRWAAKEAVSKALGTGIGEQCGWLDITINKNSTGQPATTLTGKAKRTAEKRGASNLLVTISHEGGLACAAAVIEGEGG